MSKEDFISLIVYAVMIAFAVVIGLVMIQPLMASGYFGNNRGVTFLFLFLSLVIGVVLNAIFIELGHLIGAKMGKYKILVFNVLSFAIYKKKVDGKYKFSFKFPRGYDGLTGETIIAPKDENSKPIPYVLMPLALFAIEALVTVLCFLFIDENTSILGLKFLRYGIFIVTCVGAMMTIYNFFPARLDNINDGYKFTLLNKKINAAAYNELLRIKEADFFEEDPGEIKQFEEITDFTAQVNMLSVEKYIDVDYKKSLEIVDYIISKKDKMSQSALFDVKLMKCFILFMYDEVEVGKNYYLKEFTDDERKSIKECKHLDTIRVYLLYQSLCEKSSSEIMNALSAAKRIYKKALPDVKTREHKLISLLCDKLSFNKNTIF